MQHKPPRVTVYDLTHTLDYDVADPGQAARAWDEAHAVATLQGIVNRSGPRLYLRYVVDNGRNIDDWWLDELSRPGQWLAGAERRTAASLEELVTMFRAEVAGAVVYDAAAHALSNVASTAAGADDLVAIRLDETPGSICARLVAGGPRLPVRTRLTPDLLRETRLSDGAGCPLDADRSPKCAAHLWAKQAYIETGKCNPAYLGYYIASDWIQRAAMGPVDHHTLTNHDFFVARRAFFCDLNVWDDETPVDDPAQPPGADRRTLECILRSLQQRCGGAMIHAGGFTPWSLKYTDVGAAGGTHRPVDSEWELVRVLSAYNAFLDADALRIGAMANASFFMHYPLADRYPQGLPTSRARGADRVPAAGGDRDALMFYVGDYDSAAWLYRRVADLWEDPRRGEVPLSWAISPVLARRAPMAMARMWQTRSPNDAFIAADNGAGYLNPSMLCEPRPISGLPDALNAWVRHCQAFYDRWDLRITGFIIDGHAPPMNRAALDAYRVFSPDGIVPQKTAAEYSLHGDMPVVRAGPDVHEKDPRRAAAEIMAHVHSRRAAGLRYHWFRSILRSPSWYADVAAAIRGGDPSIDIVTAPVLFRRLREELRNG